MRNATIRRSRTGSGSSLKGGGCVATLKGYASTYFCHNRDAREECPKAVCGALAEPVARQQVDELVSAVDAELSVGGVELSAEGRFGDAAASRRLVLAARRQHLQHDPCFGRGQGEQMLQHPQLGRAPTLGIPDPDHP